MTHRFTFPLTLLIVVSATAPSTAQHNDNQQEFRKKSVTAPRYRNDNNLQLNYSNRSNIAQSQEMPLIGASDEVVLDCAALMNVKADSYLAIFNMTQVGNTAKDADDLIAGRAQPFVESLRSIGIQPSDIYSDMIYLIPIFNYEVEKKLFSKTYNEVPKGFEMQKNLHIRFKDANQVDDIVTLAAANEIYDLVTIEYFVKDPQVVYDSLRNRSIAYLSRNIRKFEKLGLKLDGEFRVLAENSGVIYPESQYSDYNAFVSQSLDAARDKTVTMIRKPKTVAYNKLSYEAFDIVINPEFLEPVVQYTYKIQIKYTLNKDKLEPKNHYFIVDPNGNMKELSVKQ